MRVCLSLVFVIALLCFRSTVTFFSPNKIKKLDVTLLCGYVLLVLLITIGLRTYDDESMVNLNPFKSYSLVIGTLIEGIREHAIIQRFRWVSAALEGYVLNAVLFIPLGYLIPQVIAGARHWWKVLLVGFVLSLFIETIQLITRFGWFDLTDVIHNTLGSWIGYGLFKLFTPYKSTHKKQ